MRIRRDEMDIVIHLIDLLIKMNELNELRINKCIFYKPKSIEYDSDFQFITVIDSHRQPFFFNPFEVKDMVVLMKNGRIL